MNEQDEQGFKFNKIRRKIRFFVLDKDRKKFLTTYSQVRDYYTPAQYPDNPSETFIRLVGSLKHLYEIKEEEFIKKTKIEVDKTYDEFSLYSLNDCSAIFEGEQFDIDDDDIFRFESLIIEREFRFLMEIRNIKEMIETISKKLDLHVKWIIKYMHP